jgi:hypothetical protein
MVESFAFTRHKYCQGGSLLPCLRTQGEEFDETTPDGRETKAIVTFEDGKIVTVQTAKKAGQKSTRVGTDFLSSFFILIFHIQSVREMTGPDQMVYTMMIEGSGVVCKQTFKRI